MRKILFILLLSFLFVSCEFLPLVDDILSIIEEENYYDETLDKNSLDGIRQNALWYAKEYCKYDTVYSMSGQDVIPPRALRVDCSGMVINCYKYAISNTDYKLPFTDASAYSLFSQYTTPTNAPQPGDLIFLTYTGGKVGHVGIFVKEQGGKVYFIDSSEADSSKAVQQRNYLKTDSKIVGYGVMKFR